MNLLNLNLTQEIEYCQMLLDGIETDVESTRYHRQFRSLRRRLKKIAAYLKVDDNAQEHRHQSTFTRPKYFVHFWGRDCDQVEVHDVREFDTRKEALDAMDEWNSDDSEGPTATEFISEEDYHYFLMDPPEPRDRILEAYEDGRAMCATI